MTIRPDDHDRQVYWASSSRKGEPDYRVDLETGECDCPDYLIRVAARKEKKQCKHLEACRIVERFRKWLTKQKHI